MKSILTVSKLNFINSKIAYSIFGVTMLAQIISQGVKAAVTLAPDANAVAANIYDNFEIGMGSYSYLIIILVACFIPALNFRKFMNLNVRKSTYLQGTAINYLIAAFGVSAFNIASYYTLDQLFVNNITSYSINIMDIFGWMNNGPVLAFAQQFAFLLLVAAVIHTLTTMQTFWYGWVVDIVLIAILSVFIPVAPLRKLLLGLFYLLIFNTNALLQIALCISLAIIIYLISIMPVKHKTI